MAKDYDGSELTIKMMFERAVRGLKSQDFNPSLKQGACVYKSEDGNHCSWGWVDMYIPDYAEGGTVTVLYENKIGIAATLTADELEFAKDLQEAHDRGAFGSPGRRRGAPPPSAIIIDSLKVVMVKYGLLNACKALFDDGESNQ